MSETPIISVRNLCKTYRVYNHPLGRLKQALSMGGSKNYREFEVLKDVSFDIHRGETLGIVGRNGCGKSTLLQLICGIRKPTSGSVQVNGRISALLELGAGFHPEFSGRENVYMQGAIMGLTRDQMNRQFDAIAAFADIGEYIDQPVRTYSSGMFVRLAFAVAVHVEPDILIIDEVLAVGDVMFQQKCFELISRLQSQGTSIIVVSHNPYHIEGLSHKAALLRQGQLSDLLTAKEILARYHEMCQQELPTPVTPNENCREGTHALYFEKVQIENELDPGASSINSTGPLRIVADVFAKQPMDNIRFRFGICSSSGNELVTRIATIGISEKILFSGRHRISFTMNPCQFTSGWYYINASADNKNVRLDTWQRATEFKVMLRDENALRLSSDYGIFVSQGHWEITQQ